MAMDDFVEINYKNDWKSYNRPVSNSQLINSLQLRMRSLGTKEMAAVDNWEVFTSKPKVPHLACGDWGLKRPTLVEPPWE